MKIIYLKKVIFLPSNKTKKILKTWSTLLKPLVCSLGFGSSHILYLKYHNLISKLITNAKLVKPYKAVNEPPQPPYRLL